MVTRSNRNSTPLHIALRYHHRNTYTPIFAPFHSHTLLDLFPFPSFPLTCWSTRFTLKPTLSYTFQHNPQIPDGYLIHSVTRGSDKRTNFKMQNDLFLHSVAILPPDHQGHPPAPHCTGVHHSCITTHLVFSLLTRPLSKFDLSPY